MAIILERLHIEPVYLYISLRIFRLLSSNLTPFQHLRACHVFCTCRKHLGIWRPENWDWDWDKRDCGTRKRRTNNSSPKLNQPALMVIMLKNPPDAIGLVQDCRSIRTTTAHLGCRMGLEASSIGKSNARRL